MNKIVPAHLTYNEKEAILEFKKRVLKQFPATELILFGSKARCDYEEFLDLDILVLVDKEVEAKIEESIFDIAYDVDSEFEVVISAIVESKNFWESDLAKAMPLHWSVDKEGVLL